MVNNLYYHEGQLELPLRFSLTKAMSARWEAMPESVKQQYFDDFVNSIGPDPNQSIKGLEGGSTYVKLSGRFVQASRLANYYSMTVPNISSAFSFYVTVRLRKQKAVRGEVELTAEWAKLIGLEHRLEVPCAAGRIDIVMDEALLIVEAKLAGDYKHAIGQVLTYRHCLGQHYKCALLLLQDLKASRDHICEACCLRLGIDLYYYGGDGKLCAKGQQLKSTTDSHTFQ